MHPIEDPVPFSRSILWRLQREYLQNQGSETWAKQLVPYRITTNKVMARAYARTILGFLRDLKRGVPGAFDPARPIHIVEIGADSGRLAFFILRAVIAALGRLPHLTGLRVRYVLTDTAESHLLWWSQQPKLRALAEEGRLDFALYDAAHDGEPHLMIADQPLGASGGGNPVIVIANGAFGASPHDAFAVKARKLSELRAAATLPEPPAEPPVGNLETLERISLGILPVPFELPYYGVPAYDSALVTCSTRLADSQFLFPIAALRCLDQLTRAGNGRLLALIGDSARAELSDLEGSTSLGLVRDRVFSTRLNINLVRLVTEKMGGLYLAPPIPNRDFDTYALLRGPSVNAWNETQDAIGTHLLGFGPQAFHHLHAYVGERQDLNLEQMLAYLALCQDDPAALSRLGEEIIKRAPDASPHQRDALLAAIDRAWDGYFPIGAKTDFAFLLARLCRRLGRSDKAVGYFVLSLEDHGDDPATHYNLGRCFLDLNDPHKAAQHFRKVLEREPDNADAKAKLAALGEG